MDRSVIKKIRNLVIFFTILLWHAFQPASAQQTTNSSVDEFKHWLEVREQQNQIALQQAQSSGSNNEGASAADNSLAQQAFNQVLAKTMPLTPDQIHAFKKSMDTVQRAVAVPANLPPKPVSSTLMVSLAPGETPPAIKMSMGFISSLVLVDASGAPWPIVAYDLGNSQAFNVQWDKKSNILMIQPLQPYTYANLAIQLKGLAPPVMLTLVPGQSVVDYRVDVTIMGQGPSTQDRVTATGLPKEASASLLGVLDNIPPVGAQALKVAPEGLGEAWAQGDNLFFRSTYTVLSPAYLNHMQSPDGMHAYILPKTPSILVSKLGKLVDVEIQDD